MAVHVVLEWIGAPYEAKKVDETAAAYREINPAGQVPALTYAPDRPALTQCSAILQYLARLHPEADLLDDRSLETAAELDRWAGFITGDLHPAFFPVFAPERYTTATDAEARAAAHEAGLRLVRAKLALLEQRLAGRTWMTGDKRTILDAYVLPMLNWADDQLPDGLAAYPAAAAHRAHMLADPSVRRVINAEGLDVK